MTARIAVVSGAASGIGAAISRRLAEDGLDLGITSERPLDEQAEQLRALGRRVIPVQADLTVLGAAAGVVESVAAELGGIDVLVNTAGLTLAGAITDFPDADLQRLLALNVLAAWGAVRAAVPYMRARGGGVIVSISSIHAFVGMAGLAAYAATKGAIHAATRALAIELAPDNIRVNAVAPGLVEVDRLRATPGYTPEKAAKAVPLGRVGQPADIAALVAFLARDEASFITGQCIGVDGGASVKISFERIAPRDVTR